MSYSDDRCDDKPLNNFASRAEWLDCKKKHSFAIWPIVFGVLAVISLIIVMINVIGNGSLTYLSGLTSVAFFAGIGALIIYFRYSRSAKLWDTVAQGTQLKPLN